MVYMVWYTMVYMVWYTMVYNMYSYNVHYVYVWYGIHSSNISVYTQAVDIQCYLLNFSYA